MTATSDEEPAAHPRIERGAIAALAPESRATNAATDFRGTNLAITGRNTRPIEAETGAEVIAG